MGVEIARETKAKERRSRAQRTRADEERAQAERAELGARSTREHGGAPPSRSQRMRHVVFLVPGLLGFERFSTFSYFAERVTAALRAGLEQKLHGQVPVLAVPIAPIAALAARQTMLVKTLADRIEAIRDGYALQELQIHLVGHSTGGVDANLLTQAAPISAPGWNDLDPRAALLVSRIRSVTSIGSPHQGACLAADPAVLALGEQRKSLRNTVALAKLVGQFTLCTACDVDLSSFGDGVLREGDKLLRFLRDVLGTWALLGDLHPERVRKLDRPRLDVQRRSFVTIAGEPVRGEGVRAADAFFRDLCDCASGFKTGLAAQGGGVAPGLERLQRVLSGQDAGVEVICAAGSTTPKLDEGTSDGVVNSARQLIDPHDAHELAAVVVADHYDVLGYYDRDVWLADKNGHERLERKLAGILHSGSGFRDAQFFALYRRVADEVARAVQACEARADLADPAALAALDASVHAG